MARTLTLTAFVLAFALLAGAAPAGTAPAPAGPAVLFRRSCGDCPFDAYCEFGHPDAPEDHVACVEQTQEASHALYRRYDTSDLYYNCTTLPGWEPGVTCGTATAASNPTEIIDVANVAACRKICDEEPTCAVFWLIGASPASCFWYTAAQCTTRCNSGAEDISFPFKKTLGSCPSTNCTASG